MYFTLTICIYLHLHLCCENTRHWGHLNYLFSSKHHCCVVLFSFQLKLSSYLIKLISKRALKPVLPQLPQVLLNSRYLCLIVYVSLFMFSPLPLHLCPRDGAADPAGIVPLLIHWFGSPGLGLRWAAEQRGAPPTHSCQKTTRVWSSGFTSDFLISWGRTSCN